MANNEMATASLGGTFKKRMRNLQRMSMAVAFAEAGEFDTAAEMMEDEDEPQKKKKGE